MMVLQGCHTVQETLDPIGNEGWVLALTRPYWVKPLGYLILNRKHSAMKQVLLEHNEEESKLSLVVWGMEILQKQVKLAVWVWVPHTPKDNSTLSHENPYENSYENLYKVPSMYKELCLVVYLLRSILLHISFFENFFLLISNPPR